MKIFKSLFTVILASLSLSAQEAHSPKQLDMRLGAGLSFWNFSSERAAGSDTFDLSLEPVLAPEIFFQMPINGWLGLEATVGTWLTRLEEGPFYNEFDEARHQVHIRQGRNYYFVAGPVVSLRHPQTGRSLSLFCKAGWFISHLPGINEEFILLEDFRRRQLEYRFSRGGGWACQPGLALNTPAGPVGVRLALLANFIRAEQEYSIEENGDILEEGQLTTYYNGWVAEAGIFYTFGK